MITKEELRSTLETMKARPEATANGQIPYMAWVKDDYLHLIDCKVFEEVGIATPWLCDGIKLTDEQLDKLWAHMKSDKWLPD